MKPVIFFFLLLQLVYHSALSQLITTKKPIINQVIENFNALNPANLSSYTYTAFNKIQFIIQEDTVKRDSSDINQYDLIKKQPIYTTEFVTERHYINPDKIIENTISSNVSGLNDPVLLMLSSQIQFISFYNEYITLLHTDYLNPLYKKNSDYYHFTIEDTLFSYLPDTVFTIAYQPVNNKNQQGLSGILQIATKGYVVQNITATPSAPNTSFHFQIQQQYELINNKQWFPTQLQTNLQLRNTKFKNQSHDIYYSGTGNISFSDIKLNPDITNISLAESKQIEIPNKTNSIDSLYYQNKPVRFSPADSSTNRIIDSIAEIIKHQNNAFLIEALIYKYITIGGFNIDYSRILNINKFEGIKTGLKISTNPKIFNFASIGGFFVYGFHDKNWKYGGFAQIFPKWYSDTKLTLRYAKNVAETGGFSFLDDYVLNSSEFIRGYYITKMDKAIESELSFTIKPWKYVKINLYINHSDKIFNNYQYLQSGLNSVPISSAGITETGIQFKFAYGEDFTKTPSGLLISLGTKYPVLWVNLRYGSELFSGQIVYRKIESKISKVFTTSYLGKTHIQLKAGKVFDYIPLSNLYSAQGCYENFSFDVDNNFATIRPGEFYSKEFASVFFRQNFGNMIKNSKIFAPELHFVTNIGWGRLPGNEMHQNITFKTMEKGYFETGLLLHRIININSIGTGFGIYYRYGHYQFEKINSNFAYKLAISLNL